MAWKASSQAGTAYSQAALFALQAQVRSRPKHCIRCTMPTGRKIVIAWHAEFAAVCLSFPFPAAVVVSCSVGAGLYELSQYAFLADRNGGDGLTWAKLHDPDCGMVVVWGIFAAEWALFLFNAWYLEQVHA